MNAASFARPGYTADAVCSGELVLVFVEADGEELPTPEELRALVRESVGPSTMPVMLADLGAESSLSTGAVLYGSRRLAGYRARVLAGPDLMVMISDSKGNDIGTLTLDSSEEEWLSPRLLEFIEHLPGALQEMVEAAIEAWNARVQDGAREVSERVRRFFRQDVPVQREWQKTVRVERP